MAFGAIDLVKEADVTDASKHPSLPQCERSTRQVDQPERGNMRQRDGWYVTRTPESYVLSRHWPAQFDLKASTRLPRLNPSRLARQIRQDLWRELKGLRGFSPVIQVVTENSGMTIHAGGQLRAGPAPKDTRQKIQALLDDPARRARWSIWARIGGQGR